MEFEAIPGVGEKTAASLAELDDAERALRDGDVAALADAPGISEGRAARIARAAIRMEHDDPGGFLATDRAREVYDEVLDLLRERTVTGYAARRLETFYPSPTASRIEEVRSFVERATEREPTPAVSDALDGVEPLSTPGDLRVRDRCLATSDAERYSEAREAIPELSVEVVEDARDLAELARGYATVIALDEEFAGIDVEGDVRVEPDALESPADVVPERVLAFFAANREPLRAAAAVHREAGMDAPCDLDALEGALERLAADGTVVGDDELDRLTTAVDDLDAAVGTAESVANDRLRDSIRERDVTVEGSDLLSLVEQGAGVDSLLSRELADEYADAVAAARDHVVDALDLDPGEAEVVRRAFPDEPTFAVARFADDFDCTLPEIVDPGDPDTSGGFEIEGGRSPLLDVPRDEVDPVDYGVDGVALLSGVNSGGKTSTLDLVATAVVLAHMGLPVPADAARVERVEDLHYHAKTQGTLDAGAFESTVRQFADLATGGEGSLVLVDELESITEPGASAKIIAGILEALHGNGATGVFVSHLAGEIRDAADFAVTVDGIEARGLEDGELQVNRSPVKDHLARSTPELIVEKLATEADGEARSASEEPSGDEPRGGRGSPADHEAAFYGGLLEKFGSAGD